ncbi:DNA repair protein rad51d [Coemansia spiralis]|nr:DNA repair protein rad51d [Coemansia spiralis]
MPLLASATYIQALAAGGGGPSRLPLDECLAALAKVGIRTDYDLLLQSDVLEQTPAVLHQHIRALRMTVLEHFASAGTTAADLLAGVGAPSAAIQSGIEPLDTLLDGGISPGCVVEVCSEEAPSRTRVAIEFATGHLVSAATGPRVFMLQSGPLALWAVEQSLRRRLKALPTDQHEQLFAWAMERLFVVDCGDMDALLGFLYHYVDTHAADMPDRRDSHTADLVVIDSIRPLVIGAMQQHDGGHVAIHAVKTALRAATNVRLPAPAAVLITNGVSQRDYNGKAGSVAMLDQGLAAQPSLGAVWAMTSHVHLHLYDDPIPGADAGSAPGDIAEGRRNYVVAVLKSPSTRLGSRCRFSL